MAIQPGDPIYLNDDCHHSLVPVAIQRFAEPNPVNVRSLFVVRDEYVLMHDDLKLDSAIPCCWHLQVVADRHQGSASGDLIFNGRFGVDLQVAFPGQVFIREKIEQLPIVDFKSRPVSLPPAEGFLFPKPPGAMPRTTSESFATRHLMVQANHPSYYLAILRPLTSNRKPIRSHALTQNGLTCGLVVEGDGINDLHFFHRDSFSIETC